MSSIVHFNDDDGSIAPCVFMLETFQGDFKYFKSLKTANDIITKRLRKAKGLTLNVRIFNISF